MKAEEDPQTLDQQLQAATRMQALLQAYGSTHGGRVGSARSRSSRPSSASSITSSSQQSIARYIDHMGSCKLAVYFSYAVEIKAGTHVYSSHPSFSLAFYLFLSLFLSLSFYFPLQITQRERKRLPSGGLSQWHAHETHHRGCS